MDAKTLSNDIYEKAKELRSEADEAMSRLESIAGMSYLSWYNFSTGPAFEPQRVNPLSAGDFPSMTKLSIPAGAELTIDMMERYKSKVWKSSELEQLEKLMLEYIETGGTGIGLAVQDAIFNRAQERDLQALRDAMYLAGARTGARGFRYPTSMTKALQNEALKRHQDSKADLNREIVRLMADLAQKNTQFAAGETRAIERDYMDFSRAFICVILDIKRGILDKFRVEQNARIAEFEGTLKGLLANLNVQEKNAQLEQTFQEQLRAKWDVESRILLDKGKALIAQAEHANGLRLATAAHLAEAYIGLMQNMQANVISLVQQKS